MQMVLNFILNHIPLILFGLAMLGGFFFGWKRGFFRSAWHLLFHVIRIVAALFLTHLLSEKAMDFLFEQLQLWTIGTELHSLFTDQTISHLVRIPVEMIASLLLFAVMLLLLGLICKPLELLTRSILHLPKKKWKWLGGVVGMASGFLILTAFFAPFGGAVHVGHTVLTSLHAFPETEETAPVQPQAMAGLVDGFVLAQSTDTFTFDAPHIVSLLSKWDDSFTMKMSRRVGGQMIFENITTVEYENKTYTLTKEAQAVSKLIYAEMALFNVPPQEWTAVQAQAVHDLADAFGESEIMPTLTLKLITNANDSWKAGKTFAGIPAPDMGDIIQPTIDLLLDVFSSGTADDLEHTFTTLADVMDVMAENNAFVLLTGETAADSVLAMLSQDNLRSSMLSCLQNDRNLRVCVPEMFRISIRVAQQEMGLENADHILEQMADAINTVQAMQEVETKEEKVSVLKEEVLTISQENGLEVPAEAAEYISTFLVEEFEEHPEVTKEDIDVWLNEYSEDILTNGLPEELENWQALIPQA